MYCVDLGGSARGSTRACCCCKCGRVWPQLIEHQVLRLLALPLQIFLFAFFVAGAFGLSSWSIRYSVYLLYLHNNFFCIFLCGHVWPQLMEHEVLRLLALLVKMFFFAGAFGLKHIHHQVRYSVYLLHWYKSTNTDASIKDSIKESLRAKGLPRLAEYASVC